MLLLLLLTLLLFLLLLLLLLSIVIRLLQAALGSPRAQRFLNEIVDIFATDFSFFLFQPKLPSFIFIRNSVSK